jgi:hypothetical protein
MADDTGHVDRYDHQERLTAEEAMQHAYFNPIRGMLPLREVSLASMPTAL